MDRKHPSIDKLRDGAGQMEVGEPDDDGPITGFFKIDEERFFILKSAGVYEITMADKIDPARLNAHVPNVQQRILHLGSSDPIIGKTLQLAEVLIDNGKLDPAIQITSAKTFCFETTKHLAAMKTSSVQVANAESRGIEALAATKAIHRAIALPSIPKLRNEVTGFIQAADHSLQQLLALVEVFFGANSRKAWFESFAKFAMEKYGKDDNLTHTCHQYLPLLQFVRKARNCVEHEKFNERLIVRDFRMVADGTVARPSIEVIHPKFPLVETGLSQFMLQLTDELANATADFMAAMCAKHLRPQGPFPIGIGRYVDPPAGKEHIPYRYFIQFQGNWAPLN